MFSDPRKNIEQFDFAPGMKVADFGSGAGYYTFLLARVVGSSGRVFALDIHKDLLLTLKREATKAHLTNIDVVWADFEQQKGTKLKDNSIERGVVANVLFQITHKDQFATEISRVMRTGSFLLVIDWADSFGGLGPIKSSVVSREDCRKIFEKAGFRYEKNIDAGMHHYGLVFKKV